MRAPLVPVTIAFILGVLAAAGVPCPLPVVLSIGALSAAAACRWRRDRRRSTPVMLLLWACLGVVRMAAWSAHSENRLAAHLPDEPQAVRLHALVVDDPVGVFDPDEPSRAVCVLRLLHTRAGDGSWRPLAGRLRARLQQPEVTPAYGDEVVVDGEWCRVPSPGNPGEYDWRAALARQRIHGLLRVRPFDGVAVVAHGRGSWLLAAVAALHRRWERLIDAAFTARDAGLLRALLLGERGPLEERLKRAFVETGTVHLVARELRRNTQDTLAGNLTL